MTQKVIILGAGASAADGAPLQEDIFKEYIKLFRMDQIPKPISKAVNPFLKNFFGIHVKDIDPDSLDSLNFPTFEEVLGILEIADGRNEYFKESISKKQSLINMKRYIIEIIGIVLEKTLDRPHGKNYHYYLIDRLKKERILRDTTFLSFNYDIIIDNILMDPFFEDINYGFRVQYRDDNSIKLYKLHGSLNWLYCPYCGSLNYGSNIKTAVRQIYNQSERCRNSNCRTDKLEPLIIPPTYFKSMGNYYIQKVWKEADTALQNAQEVYLCGYSLPEADIHVKYLLKKAEVFNINKSIRFYIINGKKELKQAKKEENRFKGFFRNEREVHYTNLSFEDFCKVGLPASK